MRRVLPVAIIATIGVLPLSLAFAESISAIVKKVTPSVVQISTYDKDGNPFKTGSGFFVDINGDVVTNRHVLEGADSARINISKKKWYPVEKILYEDINGDIVRLSVNMPKSIIKPLVLSETIPPVGERVIVVGSPLGLEHTVSDGIISSIREIDKFGKIIQLTAPISSGSSGSPVFNNNGEVIGIATLQSTKGQNLNFAVPASRIKNNVSLVNMTIPQWEELRKKEPTQNVAKKNLNLNEGFRELHWGISLKDALNVYPDLIEKKYTKERPKDILQTFGREYYRKNENMEVAGVVFDKIIYFFKDGGFLGFYSSQYCDGNEENICFEKYKSIIRNLENNYGSPKIRGDIGNAGGMKHYNTYWELGKEKIDVGYSKGELRGDKVFGVSIMVTSKKGLYKPL